MSQPTYPCPNCGINNWAQDIDKWALLAIQEGEKKPKLNLERGFITTLFACQNCNYVVLFQEQKK